MHYQSTTGRYLQEMFDRMLARFGPQKWWPAETRFEMMVGAVLTQNTNWKNVEKAIENLSEKDLLSLHALNSLPEGALAQEIRAAGYYNVKARRLKNLVGFIMTEYGGSLSSLLDDTTPALREGLLSVKGIGPETADSILLYALERPVFVVDAYTHRILLRHGMAEEQAAYHELQSLFMDNLPEDVSLFNEFHALVVVTGKDFCKRKPRCSTCPLEGWGPTGGAEY